jgi:hypothetical protein
LETKLGWEWKESYTDTAPKPPPKMAANNPSAAMRTKEQKQMLPPAPVRPVPKKL